MLFSIVLIKNKKSGCADTNRCVPLFDGIVPRNLVGTEGWEGISLVFRRIYAEFLTKQFCKMGKAVEADVKCDL